MSDDKNRCPSCGRFLPEDGDFCSTECFLKFPADPFPVEPEGADE